MRVSLRGFVGAVLLLLAASAPVAAQVRIGYVDSRKVLQEMPGRAQTEAQLRTGIERLTLRQQIMADSMAAMLAAFQRDSLTLTQEQKIARFTALQVFDARYRDTVQVLETEAEEQQAAAMQPLFDQIRLALEDLRQTEGYSMIFDIGSQTNQIVSMDRNLDLSDRLLAKIRATPTAGRTTPPSPTALPTQPAPAPAARPPGPVSQPTGARRP
jgi:outer membrane protein